MSLLQSKLLALVLAMAIVAAAGLAFLASAEERLVLHGDVVSASSTSTVQGEDGAAVELPWRRVLRRRAERAGGGGGGGELGRLWRIPPSGPSSRGHVVVAVAPEEETKKREEGAGSRSTKLDPSSVP